MELNFLKNISALVQRLTARTKAPLAPSSAEELFEEAVYRTNLDTARQIGLESPEIFHRPESLEIFRTFFLYQENDAPSAIEQLLEKANFSNASKQPSVDEIFRFVSWSFQGPLKETLQQSEELQREASRAFYWFVIVSAMEPADFYREIFLVLPEQCQKATLESICDLVGDLEEYPQKSLEAISEYFFGQSLPFRKSETALPARPQVFEKFAEMLQLPVGLETLQITKLLAESDIDFADWKNYLLAPTVRKAVVSGIVNSAEQFEKLLPTVSQRSRVI